MDPALSLVVRGALALLFGAAAVQKARDLPAFRAVLVNYRLVPEVTVSLIAAGLFALEGVLAILLLLPVAHLLAAWAAMSLLALYTGAIGVNLARGRRHIDCGCGGPSGSQPLGPWLLVRNGFLMAAAVAAAAAPGARALDLVDAPAVIGGVASLALLYAATGGLAAAWPAHSRLRRVH